MMDSWLISQSIQENTNEPFGSFSRGAEQQNNILTVKRGRKLEFDTVTDTGVQCKLSTCQIDCLKNEMVSDMIWKTKIEVEFQK